MTSIKVGDTVRQKSKEQFIDQNLSDFYGLKYDDTIGVRCYDVLEVRGNYIKIFAQDQDINPNDWYFIKRFDKVKAIKAGDIVRQKTPEEYDHDDLSYDGISYEENIGNKHYKVDRISGSYFYINGFSGGWYKERFVPVSSSEIEAATPEIDKNLIKQTIKQGVTEAVEKMSDDALLSLMVSPLKETPANEISCIVWVLYNVDTKKIDSICKTRKVARSRRNPENQRVKKARITILGD